MAAIAFFCGPIERHATGSTREVDGLQGKTTAIKRTLSA